MKDFGNHKDLNKLKIKKNGSVFRNVKVNIKLADILKLETFLKYHIAFP